MTRMNRVSRGRLSRLYSPPRRAGVTGEHFAETSCADRISWARLEEIFVKDQAFLNHATYLRLVGTKQSKAKLQHRNNARDKYSARGKCC